MLKMTKYYPEFLRYYKMAKWQHDNCNLGSIPYSETPFDDDLIKNVHLYDVVERKYAGFTQILLDMWFSPESHPYKHKMDKKRLYICKQALTNFFALEEWLYVFFIHRLTGSGINYAKNPSGYHNSPLLNFRNCGGIDDIIEAYKEIDGPKFTSSGYQIAPFPKPKGEYTKGGDYFICEILPELIQKLSWYLQHGKKRSFRKVMEFLKEFNREKGFRVFYFQYGAALADIADFFPDLIDVESHFFYGKNADECLTYLAERPYGQPKLEFLDEVTERIQEDTGMLPYNAEDVACDFIRWVENYINPKLDYSHLDLDKIWSSHRIYDHPYGRQKPMLELGLVDTFNGRGHPSDDKILKQNIMDVKEYQDLVNGEDL